MTTTETDRLKSAHDKLQRAAELIDEVQTAEGLAELAGLTEILDGLGEIVEELAYDVAHLADDIDARESGKETT